MRAQQDADEERLRLQRTLVLQPVRLRGRPPRCRGREDGRQLRQGAGALPALTRSSTPEQGEGLGMNKEDLQIVREFAPAGETR